MAFYPRQFELDRRTCCNRITDYITLFGILLQMIANFWHRRADSKPNGSFRARVVHGSRYRWVF